MLYLWAPATGGDDNGTDIDDIDADNEDDNDAEDKAGDGYERDNEDAAGNGDLMNMVLANTLLFTQRRNFAPSLPAGSLLQS